MPASPSTSPFPRPVTGRLTLETIVDAACELIAAEGFEALSMRKLAQRCGVVAMTLYGYVRTKDELLAAVADRFFGELPLSEDDGSPWQEQVAAVFRSVRRMFLDHPELISIVATHRMDVSAAYRGAERVFACLRDAGLGDREVVGAFNALTSFTIGAAQREAGLREGTAGALPGIRQLRAEQFPHVISLAGLLATRDPEHDFETGLGLLIRGIEGSVRP
jgi:AcrR family transcriptional regulator